LGSISKTSLWTFSSFTATPPNGSTQSSIPFFFFPPLYVPPHLFSVVGDQLEGSLARHMRGVRPVFPQLLSLPLVYTIPPPHFSLFSFLLFQQRLITFPFFSPPQRKEETVFFFNLEVSISPLPPFLSPIHSFPSPLLRPFHSGLRKNLNEHSCERFVPAGRFPPPFLMFMLLGLSPYRHFSQKPLTPLRLVLRTARHFLPRSSL